MQKPKKPTIRGWELPRRSEVAAEEIKKQIFGLATPLALEVVRILFRDLPEMERELI